jgi:hypothetical protein
LGGSNSGIIEVLFWNLPGGTEEKNKNLGIDGVPAEIRREYFPNEGTRMVSAFSESSAWANHVPNNESVYIVALPFSLHI